MTADHGTDRRFDIGELAALAGVQTSALRYYEREGLLEPAGRTGGRRFYDERGLLQLTAITYWQDAGFTLGEMTRLFHEADGSIEEMRGLAANRIAELEQLIEHATRVKECLAHVTGCRHERLADCPVYEEQLRERAGKIAAGEYRRDRPGVRTR